MRELIRPLTFCIIRITILASAGLITLKIFGNDGVLSDYLPAIGLTMGALAGYAIRTVDEFYEGGKNDCKDKDI